MPSLTGPLTALTARDGHVSSLEYTCIIDLESAIGLKWSDMYVTTNCHSQNE